ncbi:hypothetical protein M3918_003247 [Vibrio metschnikovii]|nr:hypothetical protein [Vibrio metschnikovii]EKO3615533.1 hypothetical protein [Vibrio metschnikovii]EKO3619206.1 hypothetical protein [Vibrio metschnikovii]EKO3633128.1 hypothetical protein [Vibrio metschnikovii]EKO3636496.1 hypothetical protein [Vibrio metschnikovii]
MKKMKKYGLFCISLISTYSFAHTNQEPLYDQLKDYYHSQKYVQLVQNESQKIYLLKDIQTLIDIGDMDRLRNHVASEMAATAVKLSQYRDRVNVADGKNALSNKLNAVGKYFSETPQLYEKYNQYSEFKAFMDGLPYEIESELAEEKTNTQLFHLIIEEIMGK